LNSLEKGTAQYIKSYSTQKGSSMHNLSSNSYFIISACKGINPREDFVATNELEDILIDRGDVYGKVEERFNGVEEEGFLVQTPIHSGGEYSTRDLAKSTLIELASVFGQECIAELDVNNNLLYLHYTEDGRQEYLGAVKKVSSKPAGDYTKIGDEYIVLATDA